MSENIEFIGNIYGATGGNYAGWVYGKNGIAPTINTAGGGGRQPMILEVKDLTERGNKECLLAEQSRAEQSRAEQSRAEQSRAEQSRAA